MRKKIMPIALSAVLAGSIFSPLNAAALGSFDLSSPIVQTAINEYQAAIAPGVTEKHYSFEGKDGKKIESFVVDVDVQTPNVSIEAGTPNDGDAFGLQPVRQQAAAADGANHKVIAAVNADFYNMATGEPIGMVYKDGRAIKSQNGSNHPFFGIKKSGEAVIGSSTEYEEIKDQLQEALGGNAILVKNGQVYQTPQTGADKEPRTAVGIKADGDVFFAVIDGRQEPYSSGISMPELAQLMIDLGAVTALNLDGGGSSTFTTRELGGDQLEVDNSPSDRSERSVANTWLISTEEPSDDVFHNAHIEPYDQSFTTGSTIQFSAKGRDKSYASAPLPPSGLTWELEDPSFGTIDENGTFISNGKTGQLHVLLKYQGKEVGKSMIEIEKPDHMYFSSSELTVARNSTRPLGLITQFQKRNVAWNAQDIEFEIPANLGTIDENGVLHTGGQNVSGTITARLKDSNLTAQMKVSVGKLPEVLFNFEDSLGSWKTSTANRGETGSVSLSQYPAPVRFGKQALKVDFDLTNAQTGTTLGVYAGPGTAAPIDGEPTSIGMWVYATPEAQGYWLRMMVVDGNNKNQSLDLTPSNPGIDWTGWKYVEAQIPPSFTGPFKIHGTQAVRLMSTKSGIAGPMTKGSIYVDNIRAVFGEKVDDLNPPVIESLNVEGKEFTTNAVNLRADVKEFADDPFKTGIDWENINVFIDGKDFTKREGHYSYDMDGSVSLNGLTFADGTHKVTLMVPDKFGNQAIKTAYFSVNTGAAKMEIVPQQEKAYLGDVFELAVKAHKPTELSGSEIKLQIDKNFPVKDVIFSKSFSASTSSYDENTGVLSLKLVNNGETADVSDAAVIQVGIPASVKEGSTLAYEILDGSLSYTAQKDPSFINTFSMEAKNVAVEGAYTMTNEPILIGKQAKMTVKDANNQAVQGAEVFAVIEGESVPLSLGKTDETGLLLAESITDEVKKIELYVVKDGKYSFKINTQTYPALVKENEVKNVISTATGDPYRSKGFTWMSSPLEKENQVIQYARKKDYERKGGQAFQTAASSSSDQVFSGEQDIKKNGIVRINEITLDKLNQDTTYVYRIGDGKNWSDLEEFTTPKKQKSFEFAVLGDTQSPSDLSLFHDILGDLEQKDLAFMIHVGDLIDDSSKFKQWDDALAAMSEYDNIRSTDLVAALGNHEYMGDVDARAAKSIFNSPENGPDMDKGGTYSVDYNNIHISVLGFTSDSKVLEQQLEWLKQDVKRSNKTWNILVTHKPPYYTNPFGGNEIMKEKLPPVVDELGIDIVFSGHDHSYGRTKKIKNGVEDPNGTVYVVAGTTGLKHYDAVADEKFDFVNMENIAVGIQAKVDKGQITFKTVTSDGKIIDEFTVEKDEVEGE